MTSAKLIFCAGVAGLSMSACANNVQSDHLMTLQASGGDAMAGIEGVREAKAPVMGRDSRLMRDFTKVADKG